MHQQLALQIKLMNEMRTQLNRLLVLLTTLVSTVCFAAPEEIQVYMDEFADKGKFGLDLHTNYVLSAQPGSGTRRMLRVTPELSYGINDNLEVGLYYLTSAGPEQGAGTPVTDGGKIRFKYRPRPPDDGNPLYFAVNVEFGNLARRFNADGNSAEAKFIGVYRTGPWAVGANLNFDTSLRRRPLQRATSELDLKVSYRLKPEAEGGLQVGVENYSFLGPLRSQGLPKSRTSSNFVVADFSLGKWDFNVGIGRSTGVTSDKVVLKAIIGIPI
jgi:hypothetical protein